MANCRGPGRGPDTSVPPRAGETNPLETGVQLSKQAGPLLALHKMGSVLRAESSVTLPWPMSVTTRETLCLPHFTSSSRCSVMMYHECTPRGLWVCLGPQACDLKTWAPPSHRRCRCLTAGQSGHWLAGARECLLWTEAEVLLTQSQASSSLTRLWPGASGALHGVPQPHPSSGLHRGP